MNIFYLDADPVKCAQAHVDKHVVKMILEYAQLLAHRVIDGQLTGERDAALYKASHVNHPSARWVRDSQSNYRFLFELWQELLKEYKYRYDKIHASARLLPHLQVAPNKIAVKEFCPPWRAMPIEFKIDRAVLNYTLQSYRNYYNGAKRNLFKWKNRPVPDWIQL